jgi:hypothetical protein
VIIVLYSLVWLIIWLVSCSIAFFAGRRQLVYSYYLSRVWHRGWARDPADDAVFVIRPSRRRVA